MIKILFGLAVVLVVIGGVMLYNRDGTLPVKQNTVVDTAPTSGTPTVTESGTENVTKNNSLPRPLKRVLSLI